MFHEITDPHMTAILDSPAAPAIVTRLQKTLELERHRRQEFYLDIDDDMKVEFINGEVVMHSPVKKEHTDAIGFLYLLLSPFVRLAKLGYVGYKKVLIALTRNDYEPDVLFFDAEKAASFQKGQWKYPAPDFVVEVLSASTEERDRGIKFQDYEAHGVREYWIIDPDEESVEQYLLQGDKYRLHLKARQGYIESAVVKGFRIDIRAIFEEEANLVALRGILHGGQVDE
ncbi:MAG TPA: Uma2 family endonuclease [Saprospiraceae bacterium]|nr:Uma2 family endonuclease [Saprospiraceae bacterium]